MSLGSLPTSASGPLRAGQHSDAPRQSVRTSRRIWCRRSGRSNQPDETMAADAEESPDLDVNDFRSWWEQGPRRRPERRSAGWKLIAATLIFGGLGSIVVLALKEGRPGAPKRPPVASVVDSAATGGFAAGETPSSSVVAPSGSESSQSTQVAKEQTFEPKTQASLVSPPQDRAAPPEAITSTAPPVVPKLEGSRPDEQAAPPATQPPDTRSVQTPDRALVATQPSSQADAPKPPAAFEPASTNGAVEIEPTASSDSPTKRPAMKSPSRIAVAKREAAGADKDTITPEAPPKPDRVAIERASPQAAPKSSPASETPGEAARKSFSRMLDTIGGLFAATSRPSGQTAVPSGPVPASAGWAVQLAAPRSQTEARSDLRRITAQYATSLKGSKIGVHKAVVDGETVYRLRIVDLSKTEASALCARLKGGGGDCFVAR